MLEDGEYRKAVLEHYQNPRNQGLLDDPDLRGSAENSSCGDRVVLTAKISEGRIVSIGQKSEGCLVSRAFASMLSESLEGRKLSEIEGMDEEGFYELVGFEPRKARRNCALVAFRALKECLR